MEESKSYEKDAGMGNYSVHIQKHRLVTANARALLRKLVISAKTCVQAETIASLEGYALNS